MKKMIAMVLLLVVSIISTNVFARYYTHEVKDKHTFELRKNNLIEVEIPKGDIEIIRAKGEVVTIEYQMLFSEKGDDKKIAKSIGDKIRNNKARYWYKVKVAKGDIVAGNWTCKMKVFAPAGVKVKAKTFDGSIKKKGKKGFVELNTEM